LEKSAKGDPEWQAINNIKRKKKTAFPISSIFKVNYSSTSNIAKIGK